MNSITNFRNRLYQINSEVLLTPFPELSEEMARTTQRLRTEYGDISRRASDQQGSVFVARAANSNIWLRTASSTKRDKLPLCPPPLLARNWRRAISVSRETTILQRAFVFTFGISITHIRWIVCLYVYVFMREMSSNVLCSQSEPFFVLAVRVGGSLTVGSLGNSQHKKRLAVGRLKTGRLELCLVPKFKGSGIN